MDYEWEDRFTDLGLKMKPSDYWRRQCKATFQFDLIGAKLIDEMGAESLMWGSDYPPSGWYLAGLTPLHQEGDWPCAGSNPSQSDLRQCRQALSLAVAQGQQGNFRSTPLTGCWRQRAQCQAHRSGADGAEETAGPQDRRL
ncbi:hypothetical protein [Reyranella sp.]|uniref:hypothetical protein n=1 Tax=Reyranella sp. TaxID=1929291 RepID=UPI00272F557A|nr:hypothetical protein [Reyranella sp.]MDP2372790.1 hypothetical protein [Reyranella sp.]